MSETNFNAAFAIHLPAAQVRQRYSISDMSLWRWLNNATLNFPRPMRINQRRYWKLSELEAFDRAQAQKGREEDT